MTATIKTLRLPCGFCRAGRHELCPDAVWNPGGGKEHEGEALYCPCGDATHAGQAPRCRECGRTPLPGELARDLRCLDRADCELAVANRLETDPLHQLIVECQQTRVVAAGEVVERPRRATPAQVAQRREAKAAQVARGCTCGCGGTTKGGAFLPGHDARYVSALVADTLQAMEGDDGLAAVVSAQNKLAPFPKLLAKFERRVSS